MDLSIESVVGAAAVEKIASQIAPTVRGDDTAQAIGTAMVLSRSMDDALVILQDAVEVGTRQYMRTGIDNAIKALMAQDRTVAQRLRMSRTDANLKLIPEQPHLSPEIVVLCGSTRFAKEFAAVNAELTLAGKIVLTVAVATTRDPKSHNLKIAGLKVTDQQKKELDELHKRKIDIADSVYVINPKIYAEDKFGYIGGSTAGEIIYAMASKKPIQSLTPLHPVERIAALARIQIRKSTQDRPA